METLGYLISIYSVAQRHLRGTAMSISMSNHTFHSSVSFSNRLPWQASAVHLRQGPHVRPQHLHSRHRKELQSLPESTEVSMRLQRGTQAGTYRAPGLYEKEVDRQTLKHQNDNVHDVELPAQRLDTNWIDVLVENAR